MVLTIEKLNLQIQELTKQHQGLLNSFGSNVINYILEYQKQISNIQAKLEIINGQVLEMIQEEQKAKKLVEQKKEIKK